MASAARSSGFGPGAATVVLAFGPYQHGSLLDSVMLYGDKTDSLGTSGVTVRVALCDTNPSAAADVSAGERLTEAFDVKSDGAGWSMRLPFWKRVLAKRYVAVELSVNNAGASYVAGAHVGVRPPLVERKRGEEIRWQG